MINHLETMPLLSTGTRSLSEGIPTIAVAHDIFSCILTSFSVLHLQCLDIADQCIKHITIHFPSAPHSITSICMHYVPLTVYLTVPDLLQLFFKGKPA